MFVRHAEKTRKSSCTFSDEIASSSIEKYHEILDNIRNDLKYQQTVVSAFLIQYNDDKPEVVSIGVGTKLVSDVIRNKKFDDCDITSNNLNRVRDMHAEILARRGLRLWLWKALNNAINNNDNTVFVKNDNSKWRLKLNIKFHMYCSSMPCGNACIKRWGKGGNQVYSSDNIDNNKFWYPSIHTHPHPRLHIIQRKQGQVALLCKRDALLIQNNDIISPSSNNDNIPIGTVYPNNGEGSIHTCSDKIALWNVLGIQGGLLSQFISDPIYTETITIGRKFSEVHAMRALCCRLQDCHNIHHPVLLCSAVKLDNSVINTGPTTIESVDEIESVEEVKEVIGASFNELRCIVWTEGYEPTILDGITGLPCNNNNNDDDNNNNGSDVSRKSMFNNYSSGLQNNEQVSLTMELYLQAKKTNSSSSTSLFDLTEYQQAKSEILNGPFQEWNRD